MGDAVISEVWRASERLVGALNAAQVRTDDWTNESLSDALVDRALSDCLTQLARTGCWGRDNQLPSGELWRIAGEWLQMGVLQERARSKPLGYAGDYQMLDWIIRWQCCEHPLGRFFDRFFQRQAAPAAVRARTLLAAGAIAADCLTRSSGPYHVVSVGVGPGLDLAAAAEMLPRERRGELRFTLLDLDEAGLEFAAGQIRGYVDDYQVTTVRDNLFRLARNKRGAERLAGANFILCTGLFDYLDEASAPTLLELFWKSLAPGGRMLVGNFAPHCPTLAYMDWIGNWYLNYRTAEELAGLASMAGIPSASFSVVSERLGIDGFIEAVRK